METTFNLQSMPFRRGVVRSATTTLIGAAWVATAVVYTWQTTESPVWTLMASLCAGAVLTGLDAQRAHRRQQLPVQIRFPGSTAI